MKKYILSIIFLFCLFTVLTVNASVYIVELDRDVTEMDIDNVESFEVIDAPDRYVYMTEDIDSIKHLEQMGVVVHYEEDIPLSFEDSIMVIPSKNISVISDVYTPVKQNGNFSIMLNASLQSTIDPNTLSYAVFTNNLIAREIPKGNHKVRVGIIDSGICIYDENGNLRSDFSNVVAGASFVDDNPFSDTTNHGTPCAGLIGSKYLGVAPYCEMISLKAFNDKEGSLGDVTKAIYAGVNDYDCKVLNISAGAEGYTDEFLEAINYALDNNVIVVAAVGNEGTIKNTEMYPAKISDVIGVGSVNAVGEHSSFSRVNSTVDTCAIGEDVLVPVSRDKYTFNYGYMSGTSFSAPQVAGLAALLCSYNYDMTPGEFYEVLEAICFDPGVCGPDTTFGEGIIDVKEAVDFVIKKPQFYSSRIFQNGNNVNYKIYNNTSVLKQVTVVTANYDFSGNVINYNSMTGVIRPKIATAFSKQIICDFSQGEFFRLMLWEKFSNMKPLYKSRFFFSN